MRTSTIMPIALLGVALLVGACGGGGTGGAAAPTAGGSATEAPAGEPTDGGVGGGSTGGDEELDVCSMVDAAAVEAVLGEPAETGVDGSSGDLRVCSWKGATDPTEVLTISIYVHPDGDTARGQYLATTEGLDGVDILGLADEASYTEAFGLRVLAGRYDVSVDNTGPDEKASDLKLAQQLLPQLP